MNNEINHFGSESVSESLAQKATGIDCIPRTIESEESFVSSRTVGLGSLRCFGHASQLFLNLHCFPFRSAPGQRWPYSTAVRPNPLA